MTTSNRFSTTSTKALLAVGIASAILFATALPSFAHAATYAFVNTSMEVRTVTADNWMTAIANAFNIHTRSGVLLLNNQNDTIVGDRV
ncbi:hypothetical protein HY416_02200 [Candidatus Kaiserbacteria bacterium]|nr:hypothetical protein [Candidatus Kaiserbacteria bacterium]